MEEKIAIIDFGSQYTHLIARRIRQLNVYGEILSPEETTNDILNRDDIKGVILSGSPFGVDDPAAPKIDGNLIQLLNKPILGICYGLHLITKIWGGQVEKLGRGEYGERILRDINRKIAIFRDLSGQEVVWMSHVCGVVALPDDFEIIGSTENHKYAAIQHKTKNICGLQFHPEVTHTESGAKIFNNFVDICGCQKTWTAENKIEQIINNIKGRVGNKRVISLISGGGDSLVATLLARAALDDHQIYPIHIDNGLLRKNESENIHQAFKELRAKITPHQELQIKIVNAQDKFLNALADKYEPEEKRKIIARKFREAIDKEIKLMNWPENSYMVLQGTLYPDRIESKGTRHADKIKTHHNTEKEAIAGWPLLEPLNDLYKDEVREIGESIGIPKNLLYRHPFPGPGLAIRIICSARKMSSFSDPHIERFTKTKGLISRVLPMKTVGIQGDQRTYKWLTLLYNQKDFRMNSQLAWEEWEEISSHITNNFSITNRILRLLWSKSYDLYKLWSNRKSISQNRLHLLQEVDNAVMETIKKHGFYDQIDQMVVAIAPVGFNEGGEMVILRPVNTENYMTARFTKMSEWLLEEIVKKIRELDASFEIHAIAYDISHKPPATIELE